MRCWFPVLLFVWTALSWPVLSTAQVDLVTCIVSSEAPLLRNESVAEYVGDIRLACTGGDPASVRFINLELFLDTNITSRITGPDADETAALLLIDEPKPGVVNTSNGVTYNGQVKGRPGVAPGPPGGPGAEGSGNVYQGFRARGSDNRLVWNGIPFVPPPVNGSRLLRIVNVRGDMTRLTPQAGTPLSVKAFLSANPPNVFPIGNPELVVGRVLPSVAFSVADEQGAFQLRFEEQFTAAFLKRIENTVSGAESARQQAAPEVPYFTESGFTPDYSGLGTNAPGVAASGTRFVARFSGLPVGVHVIAASSVVSTEPGNQPGTMELRRVLGFATDFSGGTLMASGAPAELAPVNAGEAIVVYEVVALAPFSGVTGALVLDRFSVPVQVVYPQPVSLGGARVTLSYAPWNSSSVASSSAPLPRFFSHSSPGATFPVRTGPTTNYVTFEYVRGDAVPILRTVEFAAENQVITDTIAVLPATGGAWLTATPEEEPKTRRLTLGATPAGLPPGRYHSAVRFRREMPPGGLFVLPAIADVLAEPEILVDTKPLIFQAIAGGPALAPQIVYLTAKNKAVEFTTTATTQSGGNWLRVSPAAGGTPANLSVTADPSGLGIGNYEGRISIGAASAINSPQEIRVSLAVTGQTPELSGAGVVSAASYQPGSISPGEVVTLFGNGIGPDQPAGAEIGPDGRLATTVAGTRILFDGVPAPIVSVSARQSSCVVPYGAGAKRSVRVEVLYQGATSQPIDIFVTQARPGVFAANASGSGQGAILNQDLSLNSAQNPADRGSAVAIYMTGAGETFPAGINGLLNNPQRLPVPLLPVSVRIGGKTAIVEFAGGAPGAVAGVIQVNARIAGDVTPGPAVPVEVSVGDGRSQSGITVAVR